MSNFGKLMVVAVVSSVSAAVTAEAVGMLAAPRPALRAAKADSSASALPVLSPAPASPSIAKSADGHFWANGVVEAVQPRRVRVRFLVDTGATAVALTPADAQRLGLRMGDLRYSNQVVTAAGQTRAASVRLASLTVAGATLTDVDALVIEKGLDTSLLGMTFLGRLSRFEARGGALVLQR